MTESVNRLLSSAVQRLNPNIVWLLFDQALRVLTGIVSLTLTARHLGPQDFGALSYATALVAFFGFLASMGADGVIVRTLIQRHPDAERVLGAALILRSIGAVSVFFCAWFSARFANPDDEALRRLIEILAFSSLFSPTLALGLYFQAKELQKYSAIANIGGTSIAFIARIAFIHYGAGVEAFAWIQAIQLGAGSVILYCQFSRSRERIRVAGSLKFAFKVVGESWTQVATGAAVAMYMKVDQLMVAKLKGVEELGIYSAALRLSEIWYLVPTVVAPVIMPHILKLNQEDPARYLGRVRFIFRIFGAASLTVSLITTLFSDYIIKFIYGEAYINSAGVLSVHIWASVFVYLGMAQEPWNVAERLLHLSLLRTICGALSNVALNLLLIPRYGILGAAWATVISYAVAAVLGNLLSRKTWPIFLFQLQAMLPFVNFNKTK